MLRKVNENPTTARSVATIRRLTWFDCAWFCSGCPFDPAAKRLTPAAERDDDTGRFSGPYACLAAVDRGAGAKSCAPERDGSFAGGDGRARGPPILLAFRRGSPR